MKGCDNCTVRIDQDDWDAVAGAVMQLGAALESADVEWARAPFRRIADVVAAVEGAAS